MTQEERAKITSNDFADIIIEYNANERLFQRYPNATIQIMNNRFAIAYFPAAQLSTQFIRQYGYTAIPACFGLNQRSLEASGVIRLRRLPAFNLRGQGVLVGIIDTGVDYTHPAFLHKDGTSKIVSIWDQSIDSENQYPAGYFFGTEYTAEQINQALASPDPTSIVPSMDINGHGTALAGIAAGSEIPANNFSGVAPDADIVVVKLKQAKQSLRDFYVITADVPCFQENDLMWGIQYVVEVARRLQKPLAICIGVGSSSGNHDGLGPFASYLSIVSDFSGIASSVAAGNEGAARRHFYSEVDKDIGYTIVELNVGENEAGFTMEIWGTAPNTYSVDILSPTGERIQRISEALYVSRDISFLFERTTIAVDYIMVEQRTGQQLIIMRFHNPTPGIWRFQVYSRGDLEGSFHIWLPGDEFISEDTYFMQPNPYTTVTSPGNAIVPITITAYNPENDNLYQRSSRGYTTINVIKPELAAPGMNILAPALNHGFAPMNGTSAAAAHAAGIVAMLLEWGIVRGSYPGMDTIEVKRFLIRGAKRNATQHYPNRDWGFGIIDIFNVFDILRTEIQ
jgi:subtilisin family serine protease